MLSRIAESCYWIGRFVERADYTARLLDVHYHNLLQSHSKESDRLAHQLLSVMGSDQFHAVSTIEQAVHDIAFEPSFVGSITDSIAHLSENAKGVRDTIPSELFESIYATYVELQQKLNRINDYPRHELFQWVRNRCMMIHGTIDESMARDDSYHYLNIGRCIERVDMSARMVAVRCAMDNNSTAWLTMLHSCGAFEAYMRTVGDSSDTLSIIDFLLRDSQFPRSILSSASAALGSAQALTANNDTALDEKDPRFALGRLCAEIEFTSISEVHDDLMKAVTLLQSGVRYIDESMEESFFRQSHAIEWRQ